MFSENFQAVFVSFLNFLLPFVRVFLSNFHSLLSVLNFLLLSLTFVEVFVSTLDFLFPFLRVFVSAISSLLLLPQVFVSNLDYLLLEVPFLYQLCLAKLRLSPFFLYIPLSSLPFLSCLLQSLLLKQSFLSVLLIIQKYLYFTERFLDPFCHTNLDSREKTTN